MAPKQQSLRGSEIQVKKTFDFDKQSNEQQQYLAIYKNLSIADNPNAIDSAPMISNLMGKQVCGIALYTVKSNRQGIYNQSLHNSRSLSKGLLHIPQTTMSDAVYQPNELSVVF